MIILRVIEKNYKDYDIDDIDDILVSYFKQNSQRNDFRILYTILINHTLRDHELIQNAVDAIKFLYNIIELNETNSVELKNAIDKIMEIVRENNQTINNHILQFVSVNDFLIDRLIFVFINIENTTIKFNICNLLKEFITQDHFGLDKNVTIDSIKDNIRVFIKFWRTGKSSTYFNIINVRIILQKLFEKYPNDLVLVSSLIHKSQIKEYSTIPVSDKNKFIKQILESNDNNFIQGRSSAKALHSPRRSQPLSLIPITQKFGGKKRKTNKKRFRKNKKSRKPKKKKN